MKILRRKQQVQSDDIDRARRARIDAERRLAYDTKNIIASLDEIRETDSVSQLLDDLITRRAREINT